MNKPPPDSVADQRNQARKLIVQAMAEIILNDDALFRKLKHRAFLAGVFIRRTEEGGTTFTINNAERLAAAMVALKLTGGIPNE